MYIFNLKIAILSILVNTTKTNSRSLPFRTPMWHSVHFAHNNVLCCFSPLFSTLLTASCTQWQQLKKKQISSCVRPSRFHGFFWLLMRNIEERVCHWTNELAPFLPFLEIVVFSFKFLVTNLFSTKKNAIFDSMFTQ